MASLGQILVILVAAAVGFALSWLAWHWWSSRRWTRIEKEWEARLAEAEQGLDSAGAEYRALEDALTISLGELASLKPEGIDLRARFRDLEVAMVTADTDLQELVLERVALLAQVGEMETTLASKDADLETLNSERADIRIRLEGLENTLASGATELELMR